MKFAEVAKLIGVFGVVQCWSCGFSPVLHIVVMTLIAAGVAVVHAASVVVACLLCEIKMYSPSYGISMQ